MITVIIPALNEEKTIRQVIHQEIDRLPERLRQPVLLCYLEGRTQDEAARELGWSLGALRGRLNRGREKFRANLGAWRAYT